MGINFDFTFNLIAILTGILAWMIIGFLSYQIYKKQAVKPTVWKLILVIFVGLFSFTINGNKFDEVIKLPILPLGVWIVYFVLKRKQGRWQTYRSFAWLGFWSNFIFLVATLLTIPFHNMIYPKNAPSTYISNVENASIIKTHPTAKERYLNKEGLQKQLHYMRKEKIYSEQWYRETYIDSESNKRNERFPYQLIGASSKWGSGLNSIIYIEGDGKGILVSTSKKQYYFRSDDLLIEEGK